MLDYICLALYHTGFIEMMFDSCNNVFILVQGLNFCTYILSYITLLILKKC